jgi:hypothetical protein
MKSYVEFNAEMRKKCKSAVEKQFYKDMNNFIYGKTLESVRGRHNIELVINEERLDKIIAQPTVQTWRTFTENLVAVKRAKEVVNLDKPVFLGFTILEMAKQIMYDFHYNYIKPKYGKNARLLFTDTDSLCYAIETENIYKDMLEDKHMYDLSEFPEDHMCYNTENKKKLGVMKDETKANRILEFVGLKAKMYSILLENGEEIKRAKGVGRQAIQSDITHQDYKDTLFNELALLHSFKTIRSKNHQISTLNIHKRSLNCYDDKRYLLDSTTSLPYGHKDIINKT